MNVDVNYSNEFRKQLKKKIFLNLPNFHNDNFDIYRKNRNNGRQGLMHKLKQTARSSARSMLKGVNWYSGTFFSTIVDQMHEVSDAFSYLYSILEDEHSKALLLEIGAFRVLGNTRIKLPLSGPEYWNGIQQVEQMADKSETIDPGFEQFKLFKFDLSPIGYPLKLYFNSQGIYTDFVLKQYEYKKGKNWVGAADGDIVIDGGGCWGDTALYFAHHAGKSGRVYSFEFIPGNIDILNKNMALNPALNNIAIVKNPLWSASDKDVYFTDFGPASKVYFDKPASFSGKTSTLTIDDFVQRNNIERLDFLKLDIEGAEMEALKGARNTIIKHRPKLAIALYHDVEDFLKIPRFINELGLGYKFFIDHFTIHHEETILFASVDANTA
jgi:FkbM family methyltransferase